MLSSETKMLAKNAVQKPATLKPLTNFATSKIISALITRRKKPSVTSVSGNVNKINTGRTNALAKPSNSAAMMTAPELPNLMPRKT